MITTSLLKTWVRGALLEAKKPLAGLGDSTPDSPFGGSASGHMAFVAEWAVYFAAVNPGDLTAAEWKECQSDARYSSAFVAANDLVKDENNPAGPMAQNLNKVQGILSAMKQQASAALSDLASNRAIDISPLPGNGSKPKPDNDEVDVTLAGVDVHVKVNDEHRVGGLIRGKLTKGAYLEGYISTDIYYRAIESLVRKYVLDESTAVPEYRDKIVDVDTGSGKPKTFITTKPDASSNISLGRSVIKLKKDAKGNPVTNKKDQPVFTTPTFELSREMTNMGVDITDERFIALWERSKIGGPSVHVPDPTPKLPKRTGYGVEFRSRISPKDLGDGQSYLRMTPRGFPFLLQGGKDTWTYEHYLDSGFGNMKNPGKDPAAKEAQAAYFKLFKDKHDEFTDLLDTMGYKDAIVEDATRKLFGVVAGQQNTRETAYVKFTVPWNQMPNTAANAVGDAVGIDSIFYPGIPAFRVVEEPPREGVNPSVYYKLYGTDALKDKELAYIKFRHFDGNRPPQVFLGKDASILTQEVDLFSQQGGVSSALDTVAVQRQLTQQPVHTATEYFQDKPEVRDDIVKRFLSDNNIVIQQGVEVAPVTRDDIHSWVTSNWSNLSDHVPTGGDGAENETEAKAWVWAMIAQELKDLDILAESAVQKLGTIIAENIIRRWVRMSLMNEQRAVI